MVKEMIYMSTMTEEFPDLCSNCTFSNELFAVNRSTAMKTLTAKMHACRHVNIQCKLSIINVQFTSSKPLCT